MAASPKTSSVILVGLLALALVLTSCSLRAKSPAVQPTAAKPAASSAPVALAPLSSPQTQVELPKPQPIDPAALATENAAPQPVEPPPAPRPPATQPQRKNPPRPETTVPTPAPVIAPPEPTREPVQEIVSAADLKRFQDSAQNHRREVARILESLKTRRLSKAQQNVLSSIRSFVALSEDAEKRNDMRQADSLAERALILARDLQNGK